MKLLIISYFFKPNNGVGAYRATSYAEQLSNEFEVKVICNSIDGKEITQNFSDKLSVHYLNCKSREISKLGNFISLINNIQDYHNNLYSKYQDIEKITIKFKPDLIIASSGPINSLKIAYKLSKKLNIPYVCDIRDYHNEFMTNKLDISLKSFHFILKDYLTKKYFKNSLFNITVTEVITEYIKKTNKNTFTILNGFETINTIKNPINKESFILSFIGVLYPIQVIDPFFDAFKIFSLNKSDVKLYLIGSESQYVVEKLKILDPTKYYITQRIPKVDIYKYIFETSIFLQFPFKNQKGIYSTKLFDYLPFKKNILLSPSDSSVMSELINETKAGITLNTKLEILNYLEETYKNWKENGQIPYFGMELKIDEYSRENQNKKFITLIKKFIL